MGIPRTYSYSTVSCLSPLFMQFLLPNVLFLGFLSSFFSFIHLMISLFQEAFLGFLYGLSLGLLWPVIQPSTYRIT